MNKYLPLELVNKSLILRLTHPRVNILRDYAKKYLREYDVDNMIYCKNPISWMQIIHCCEMYCFNYKYKSYRRIYKYKRMYKYYIDEIDRKIDSYNIYF